MKKWFLGILASAMILVSCQDKPPVNYLEYVVGQWVNNAVDNKDLPTDSIKVINFGANLIYTSAHGSAQTDGRMLWFEMVGNKSYRVVGNKIIIESLPGSSPSVYMRYNIEYISSITMIYSIEEILIDQQTQRVPTERYCLERSIVDLSDAIVGVWQTDVAGSTDVWIWDIKADGKYDFYIYDPVNKEYKSESIDKSFYKLYGRYIVNIFADGFTGEPTGETAEVWAISEFTTRSMKWMSLYEDGKSESHRLIRVGKLP